VRAAKQAVVCVEHGLWEDMDSAERRSARILVWISTPPIAGLRLGSPAAHASLPDDREDMREQL